MSAALQDWRSAPVIRSATIGNHVFTVRQAPGSRLGTLPRHLEIDGRRIKLDLLPTADYCVAWIYTDRIDRVMLDLIEQDNMTVQINGRGPDIPVTLDVLKVVVPAHHRLDLLAFVYGQHTRPTLVHSR